MAKAKSPISWHELSHGDRYRRLKAVGWVWFRHTRHRRQEDIPGRTIHLDGSWISDAPSFHLALGEAVNGPNGYFGWNLDALDDCLIRGFGVIRPLTIRLSRFNEVRKALDRRATLRIEAERLRRPLARGAGIEEIVEEIVYNSDGNKSEVERMVALYMAVLADEPVDCDEFPPYFDLILDVFASRGVEFVPDNEEVQDTGEL